MLRKGLSFFPSRHPWKWKKISEQNRDREQLLSFSSTYKIFSVQDSTILWLQMTWMFTWFFMASKRAKNWGHIWIWHVVWNFLLLCLYLPMHFPAIQLHKTMLVISSSYWLSIVSPNINLVVTRVSLNVPNPHYYYMCYHCYLLFCLIREETKMRKPHSKSEFEPVLASEPAFFLCFATASQK